MEIETKACPKCGELKGPELFSKDNSKKDGRSCWCKKCVAARQAENKEGHRKRQAAYQARNPEKRRAAEAAWRERNPEKHRAIVKKWRDQNAEAVRAGDKRKRDLMTDTYVLWRLVRGTGLSFSDIPQTLVDLKREQLRLVRELKKEQNHEER